MGLLDDAIREHLDLKRKHGATEEELRRQEVEALGPARRDFVGDGGQAPEPVEPARDVVPEPAPEPAGWLEDEPADSPFEPAVTEHPPVRPEPIAEPAEPVAEAGAPTLEEEPLPTPEPAPVAEVPPVPARRESETPTQGFDALGHDDEPPPDGEEDVLEETPDFLQDTPEHDRLWFEQKPPRDFDFDD